MKSLSSMQGGSGEEVLYDMTKKIYLIEHDKTVQLNKEKVYFRN